MPRRRLTVTGMQCTGCETVIADALARVSGVAAVEADHEADAVALTCEDEALDPVVEAVEDLGYEVAR